MNLVQQRFCSTQRERLSNFPPLPNTGFPLINYFHEEALCCLEAGLDQAALMTTSVLLEAALKLLVILHAIGNGAPALTALKKWNTATMAPVIDELGRRQVINPELVRELHEKRQLYRNVFQHGNTPLLDSDGLREDDYTEEVAMMSLIAAQPLALMHHTQRVSFDWFLFVDRTVRNQIPWEVITAGFKGRIEINTKAGLAVVGHGASGVLAKSRSIWGRPLAVTGVDTTPD